MEVNYEKTGDLVARMTVRVSRKDYESKYRSALLDYRKKTNLKGFRKGKVPFGYLEKLFGQEVLTKTVSDLLTDSVNDYLEAHEVPYIGQPLPATGQEMLAFDPRDLKDEYTYAFDIGLLPDFDVQGMDEEIEWYDVPVTDEEVDSELQELLKRQGSYVSQDKVDDESRIHLRMQEWEDGTIKEGGKEHSRRIYMQMVSDDVKNKVMGKVVGSTFDFDPNTFLKEGDMRVFRRYYFDIKDDDEILADRIHAEIIDIETLKPAEPDEEFFNAAFEPGKVNNEEEARNVIREALKQRNDIQSDGHLRHMIEHRLIDSNQFDLPHEFLDRLLGDPEEAEQETGNTDAAQEVAEGAETEQPAEQVATESKSKANANEYRWHFIKDKLARKFNIEVSQDEIVRAAADNVYNRFGGYMPYDKMREIISRYLGDKDSVAQLRTQVVDTKLFETLKDQMPVVKKEVSKEAFEAMLEEHRHEH